MRVSHVLIVFTAEVVAIWAGETVAAHMVRV